MRVPARNWVMAAVLAMAAQTPAAATTLLTDVTDYNAFILGGFASTGSDTEGRLAVGGSAAISSYGIAQVAGVNLGDTYTFVVAGALAAGSGQVHQGKALVGGAQAVSPSFTATIDTPSPAQPMLDFAGEGARLKTLSAALATRTANGTVVDQYGGLTLTGGDAGLNVFSVTAAQLSGKNNFTLAAPTGSLALVNVSGTAASLLNQGFSLNGIDRSRVLFNFVDATALTFGGIGLQGSFLAPKAAVQFANGQLNGLLVAESYSGSGQLNYAPYRGGLLDRAPVVPGVPEPATWAMMIGGIGLTGGALRRRARVALPA